MSTAGHLSKVLGVIVTLTLGSEVMTLYRGVTLFLLAMALARTVAMEEKLERSVSEVRWFLHLEIKIIKIQLQIVMFTFIKNNHT